MALTNGGIVLSGDLDEADIAEHLELWEERIHKLRETKNVARRCYADTRRRLVAVCCKLSYFWVAGFLRENIVSFLGWRWAVVLVGAVVVGGLFLTLTSSPLAGLWGVVFGVALFQTMVSVPSDMQLVVLRNAAKNMFTVLTTRRKEEHHRVRQIEAELRAANQSMLQLANQLEQFRQSRRYRLRQLAVENWRAMRGEGLEEFLERVFSEQRYSVQRIGRTGDQGVDLILTKNGSRIAVQVKGYLNSVPNTAIQEAYAGMAFHACDACAVITNSRFTSGGKSIAEGVGCFLVDEDSLPMIIMEELDLWQEALAVKTRKTGNP